MRVGPLISPRQRDKVQDLVEDAVRSGAKVLLGGEPAAGEGYFYPPTVLSGIPEARASAGGDLRARGPRLRLRHGGGGDRRSQ